MSRLYVWPHSFMLYACKRPDALSNPELSSLLLDLNLHENHGGIPVMLRWSTDPTLGFPRQPFKLWRRQRWNYDYIDLKRGSLDFTSKLIVDWYLEEMYIVRFYILPSPGTKVRVQALDRNYQPIPGQIIDFNASGIGIFTSPGIAGLLITGRGYIKDIQGVHQDGLANSSGWELVQVVGFPFGGGEVNVYNTHQLQGYVPASLDGLSAARQRLFIASVLHQPLPDTGIADFPTPLWPAADPFCFLKYLREINLSLIYQCLENTDDKNPSFLQADFVKEVTLSGIRQADIPGAVPGTNPTIIRLPVVGVTMLSISTSSDAATGLGYGTIDFPPKKDVILTNYQEPDGTVQMAYDYMITTNFILPSLGSFELAAIAIVRPDPEPVTGLTVSTFQVNRAITLDGKCTESVRVSWNLSFFPQAYAILVSHKPGYSNVLNSSRPKCDGYNPFVAVRPPSTGGSPPAGFRTTFTDPVSPLPIDGSQTNRYLVVGTDVFGRWSDWRLTTHIATALPVIQPGLYSATFIQDVTLATGRTVPSKMEIDFSWDWTDRSPDRIEFTGGFISPTEKTIPVFTSGFALSPLVAPSPNVVISFNSSGNPYISSGHSGSLETLTPTPPDPNRRKYRLTLDGLSCDYTTANKVAYALFARGAESVRPKSTSDLVGPRRAEAINPLPPPIPNLPIDLQWTALPDATGRARGILSWPAVSFTAKYVVWEATESALLVALSAPPPVPGTSLLARAASLRSLLTSSAESQSISLQAFSRMNTDLLATTYLEVELPSSSSIIYAYRVSSVETETNIESERSSTIALFAVPHRNQPGQPSLILRRTRSSLTAPAGKIKIIAIPGTGLAPIGYRLFRVRSETLLADPGIKGPPKFTETDPEWEASTLQTLKGSINGMAIEDSVSPSWYPYYYQITSIGLHNPAAGEYGGESLPSSVQSSLFTPPDAPLLTIISNNGNDSNRVITFRTNLPVKPISQGHALIELIKVSVSSDGRGIERNILLSVPANTVQQGPPMVVLPSPTPEELVAMPQINRGEINSDETVIMTLRLQADVEHGSLVAIDPLSRTTQVEF